MHAPGQALSETPVRRRTRLALVAAAGEVMEEGEVPTVADAAERAEVSRATAYRYFPSQASLLEAVLDERLDHLLDGGPILDRAGLEAFTDRAAEALRDNEAQLRAALRLALSQKRGTRDEERPLVRGGRLQMLDSALPSTRIPAERRKVLIALSLLFGIEAWIVLKDIWRLDDAEAREVLFWTASAITEKAGLTRS